MKEGKIACLPEDQLGYLQTFLAPFITLDPFLKVIHHTAIEHQGKLPLLTIHASSGSLRTSLGFLFLQHPAPQSTPNHYQSTSAK